MSKIRQAVKYERQLADAKVKAHTDLTATQLEAERKLTEQAIAYERTITDGQFGQLNLIADDHRQFHEREHLLYEDAIEKAATSLKTALDALDTDMSRFREEAGKWMTVDRFDREHSALSEKFELAIKTLSEKIGAEERVTLRSQAQEELLNRIQQNNRWLVGILVTLAIFGVTTILHLFNII